MCLEGGLFGSCSAWKQMTCLEEEFDQQECSVGGNYDYVQCHITYIGRERVVYLWVPKVFI